MLNLGKKPARPGSIKLKLADFFDLARLPEPPDGGFGHYGLGAGLDWSGGDKDKCLGNCDFGCCVFTGFARRAMVWTHHSGRGKPVPFIRSNILQAYAAATGFNYTKETDEGTDMQEGLAYLKKTGISDATGKMHKIDGYLALEAGNVAQLRRAMYIFGAADIGIRFPTYVEELIQQDKPWAYQSTTRFSGGHYIPGVGENSAGQILAPTWNMFVGIEPAFIENYCDEAAVAFSYDQLDARGFSPEGYDKAALQSFMQHFK